MPSVCITISSVLDLGGIKFIRRITYFVHGIEILLLLFLCVHVRSSVHRKPPSTLIDISRSPRMGKDDSGAEELRNLCVGLGVALFLSLLVLSWVFVTWQCSRAMKLPKNIPGPSTTPPAPNAGGGQDAAASDDKHEGTGSTASTPQNYNIHTTDVERSRAMDDERDGASEISGEFEGEGRSEPPMLRSCSSQLSLRSFRSLRSLRSSTSLDNLELQQPMS